MHQRACEWSVHSPNPQPSSAAATGAVGVTAHAALLIQPPPCAILRLPAVILKSREPAGLATHGWPFRAPSRLSFLQRRLRTPSREHAGES
jgi:hypothetical protein